jgi:hypothetical protein
MAIPKIDIFPSTWLVYIRAILHILTDPPAVPVSEEIHELAYEQLVMLASLPISDRTLRLRDHTERSYRINLELPAGYCGQIHRVIGIRLTRAKRGLVV